MTIKNFYSNTYAPNPLRVTYMLKLKGIELDFIDIDIRKGQQHSPDYKAVSAEGTVPALELEDGAILTDVIAILYYIEKSYPDTLNLLGTTVTEQAQILGLIHHIHLTGFFSIADVLRNGGVPGFEDRALPGNIKVKQIPDLMERGRSRIAYFYQQIDQKLEGGEFLVSNTISQADIDLYVMCNFAGFIKETFDPAQAQNLSAHFNKVDALIKQA